MARPRPDPGAARPLDPVALCLSGGGFRAACFHLGALDVLDALGLLERVRVLSTASGGTLLGAAWALSVADREPFERFFARTYAAFRDLRLPERALEALGAARGPRSLVRAAADVYDAHLFGGRRFGAFALPAPPPGPGHPPALEVVLNATELATGLPFRFQASLGAGGRPGRVGNGRVFLDPEAAQALRVADVAAASSCFPGGFEPMRLPEDFGLPPGALRGDAAQPSVALLDGGIVDNQAMESALLAAVRLDLRPTLLASDTTRPYAPFVPAPRPAGRGRLAVWHLVALAVAAPLALAALAARAARLGPWELLLGLPVALVTAAPLALLAALAWRLRRHRGGSPVRRVAGFALRLGAGEALAALRDRLDALLALTADVFPARVRRAVYARVWKDPRLAGRRIANLVYELAPGGRGGAALPPEARATVARAVAVPTALWFTDPGQLPDLVAAGQLTTAYNLLQHLEGREWPAAAREDAERLAAGARALLEALGAEPRARLPREGRDALTSAAPAFERLFGA